MKIISHRGYWRRPEEKNTVIAFRRSFDLGFGTETDVRDLGGKLVISHDPPTGGELDLVDVIDMADTARLPLALNVKADGLAPLLADAMRAYDPTCWFVFDMSIPDTRQQLRAGNPVFVRVSEYEPTSPFASEAAGVWLDAFEADAWRLPVLAELLGQHRRVCLVSPELHHREHEPFWTALLDENYHRDPMLTLCTDFPETAVRFFGEER